MGEPCFLQIARPGRPERLFRIEPGVYPIGSDAENLVVLPDTAVNWRHAVLTVSDDALYIEDLMTESGTFLDGGKVTGRRRFMPGQRLQIGPYTMVVRTDHPAASEPPAREAAASTPPPAQSAPPPPKPAPAAAESSENAEAARARHEEEQRRRSVRRQIQTELLQRLDIKRLAAGRIEEKDLRRRALEHIRQIIHDVRDRLPPDITPGFTLRNSAMFS